MNNLYAMDMILKQRQEEIRKQTEMYNRNDRTRNGSEEGSMLARRGLMVTIFLLGLIMMI